MPTITFDQVHQRVAAFHAAEATRTAPKPAAIRTVYQLVSLLGELNDGDHYAVVELLHAELAVLGTPAD